MSTSARALGDSLGEAFDKRDPAILRAIYADDMTIWHGATNGTMGKEENIGLLTALFSICSRLEYTNIVRHDIENGVVQQHTLVGEFADGTAIPSLNACLIIKTDGNAITGIWEYFDKETFNPVWARLAALAPAD